MKNSVDFGFPNYEYDTNDELILVKADNHIFSMEKYG